MNHTKSKSNTAKVSFFEYFLERHNLKVFILILIIGSFLRLYRYNDRWALSYDHAWFAVIARHAIDTFQLPFLGPFASGGPFQTGGEWFWIVMIGILLNPSSVISPWFFITFISIFQILLAFYLGKKLINYKFGLILSLVFALSPSQVVQATNLTSPTTESMFALLFLIFLVKFIETRLTKYVFFAGLTVGTASAVHAQGFMLLIPLFIFLIIYKIFNFKRLTFLGSGLLIPWLPVVIVDVQNNFYNTINMLLYFSSNQTSASYEELGRRWLTFITIYIPFTWGRIIGGNIVLGFIEIVFLGILFVYMFVKQKIKRFWVFLSFSVGAIFIVLRYTKAPLFENYTTFLHPFILLLTAYLIYSIYKKNLYVGIFFTIAITIFSLQNSLNEIWISTNITAQKSQVYLEDLKDEYAGKKFNIYDYRLESKHVSLPAVYYLQTAGLTSSDGLNIGFVVATLGAQPKFKMHKLISGSIGSHQLFLLSSTSAELERHEWAPVSPEVIYNSVQYWYK